MNRKPFNQRNWHMKLPGSHFDTNCLTMVERPDGEFDAHCSTPSEENVIALKHTDPRSDFGYLYTLIYYNDGEVVVERDAVKTDGMEFSWKAKNKEA